MENGIFNTCDCCGRTANILRGFIEYERYPKGIFFKDEKGVINFNRFIGSDAVSKTFNYCLGCYNRAVKKEKGVNGERIKNMSGV